MGNLIYLMDLILYQIFKVILKIPERKHSGKIDNPTIRIYISKTENRITFKVNTEYYHELLMLETMKLL